MELTEIITARCINGKIKGCIKNSLIWFHEKRHQEQGEIPFYKNFCEILEVYMTPLIFITLLGLCFSMNMTVFGWIWLFYFLVASVLPEIDAWLFGLKNWIKFKSISGKKEVDKS